MTKPLNELELDDFDAVPIWATDLKHDDLETVLAMPGKTQIEDGESDLWVRFSGAIADGTSVRGIAMVETPPPRLLLWSFFIEGQWLTLHLPPAPEFVLARTGPDAFARTLSRHLREVFPIRIHTEVKAASTGLYITDEITLNSGQNA